MTNILDLCHEVLHVIFEHLGPDDIAALTGTCQAFHLYMQNNNILWRNLYLQHYDDPRKAPDGRTPDWETELKELTRVKNIFKAKKVADKTGHVDLVCETAIRLATEADVSDQSKNLEFLRSQFDDSKSRCRTNASVFIHSSTLYSQSPRRRRKPSVVARSQSVAHLHCLHGIRSTPIMNLQQDSHMEATSLNAHSMARAHVYDLANYCQENKWGPFKNDGSLHIDWEKVEAIMIDLAYNLHLYDTQTSPLRSDLRCEPFDGVQPQSYESVETDISEDTDSPEASTSSHGSFTDALIATMAYTASREVDSATIPQGLDQDLQERDPYGVTGTWERVVCFLDYNDFIRFNFDPSSRSSDGTLPQQEALRLIRMKVRVTKIEPPGEEDGQDFPVVHFEGRSCSMHMMWDPNANSRLTGK
jgi:hypothetical protein